MSSKGFAALGDPLGFGLEFCRALVACCRFPTIQQEFVAENGVGGLMPLLSREGSLIATLLSRAASARAGSVPLSAPVLLCPNGMPAPAALATLLSQ